MTDTSELANLFAGLFIARPDVKAIQTEDGGYRPVVVDWNTEPKEYRPWKRKDFEDHLAGRRTYGHYLLSRENEAKLFAFDIDFDKKGKLPQTALPFGHLGSMTGTQQDADISQWEDSFTDDNPREAWLNRRHPARAYMKFCLRNIANILQKKIESELELPTAVAYTGNKGIHVYGFTGKMPAAEVRQGAALIVDDLPLLPLKGNVFYEWDPSQGCPELDIFTIEVFPKQDETSATSGFGNLMRLPLGVNRKNPKDPTFFVDTGETVPLSTLRPTDPLPLLRGIKEKIA